MHHKNNRFSTSNHNNPQHHKPNNNIPTGPAPGGSSTPRKSNFLNSIREKFKEKPATKEEVEQLGLQAKKETYKTQIHNARQARPSKLGNMVFGSTSHGRPPPRSSGRQYRQEESGSFLFGSGESSGKGFLDSESSGEGINEMLGMGSSRKSGRGKKTKSGFDEMFGI